MQTLVIKYAEVLAKAQRLDEKVILARAEFEMACKDKDEKAQDTARLKILEMTEMNIDLVKEGVETYLALADAQMNDLRNKLNP